MTYHLQIVTPDGLHFDGQAERVTLYTAEGQISILARHINYVAPLSMGPAKVATPEGVRHASCIGGMVAVTDGKVKVVATAFEWADRIDIARAQDSRKRAEALLADPNLDPHTRQAAQARLKRAQVRLNAAENREQGINNR